MRRADRLFQIIQVLRRTRKPLTAEAIAGELETSKRTIYRDIATLIGQRVPIRGEAGTGYVLEKGFDMPPAYVDAGRNRSGRTRCTMGGRTCGSGTGEGGARSDRENRRDHSRTAPAARARTSQPRITESWIEEADTIDMTRLRAHIHAEKKVKLRLPR